MSHQNYGQNKHNCWQEYCRMHPLCNTDAMRPHFDWVFGRAYALGKQEKDAEGEEMLTVSRKKVQELFANARKHHDLYTSATCINESESRTIDVCLGRIQVLDTLFGSKCLPDEQRENLSEVKRSLSENLSEHKPDEPKYNIGQYVRHKTTRLVDVISGVSQSAPYIYHFNHMVNPVDGQGIFESDLEPYTEPKEDKAEEIADKAIEPVEKHFNTILKDSFRNERRLNIATTIMAGVMASPNIIKSREDLKVISDKWLASRTLELTDVLIAECEKGDNHEKA